MATTTDAEYDPFAAFDDVVAGTTRDPYPSLAVKRRETPGAQGHGHLARGPARGHRRRARMDGLPLRGLLAHPARRQDVHLDRLRRHHRHGDGPHDPRHGRPRAPDPSQPGRPRLPGEVAGPLGARVHRPDRRRAHRPLRGRRRGRPGPPAHLRVPRPGDRSPARAARGGLPQVPALVGGADRARGRHRPGHRPRPNRCATTSPRWWPNAAPIRPRT